MRQRGNVNVSGGGSKVKYYMSLEFLHETGHYKTEKLYSWNNQLQNYNYTFQNNISYKLTPTTTISMNMNAQIHQNTRPNVNADNFFASVMDMTPVEFPTTFPAREGIDHVMFGCYDKGGGNFPTTHTHNSAQVSVRRIQIPSTRSSSSIRISI